MPNESKNNSIVNLGIGDYGNLIVRDASHVGLLEFSYSGEYCGFLTNCFDNITPNYKLAFKAYTFLKIYDDDELMVDLSGDYYVYKFEDSIIILRC